ncbi:MAG: PIN domain-containing protein [Chloroflexi bacterium]|nr:PIN domain-containing protein [Chloroflexota bacterium]
MDVLIDTSVWSLALRRRARQLSPSQVRVHREWAELVQEGRAVVIGPVRQELLSGIPDGATFERLRERLQAFDDLPLTTGDYEEAARFNNRCRASGVAGSAVDLLICAAAARRDLAIFTADADFRRYARVLPVKLHEPRGVQR